MSNYQIMVGDCVERLRDLADASIDAVVTDPPYGLSKQPDMAEVMRHWLNGDDYEHKGAGFMGKSWDSFVPGPSVWRECFRVLKPGGHLLSFFGSRTYDIGTLAIRLAGFEVRDQIMWVYGSGFPKSLDITKAIDKMDAAEAQQARRYKFTEWVRSTGLTSKQIDQATNTNMGGHYTTTASQPAIMTVEHLDAVRHLIGEVPEWVERECQIRSVESENYKKRKVVGKYKTDMGGLGGQRLGQASGNITAPLTEAAKQWQGWGTALKPSHEPIVMARKPISTTVAANVLEHATGAINVDGCRIKYQNEDDKNLATPQGRCTSGNLVGGGIQKQRKEYSRPELKGRWPANFIHDGSDEATQGLGEASRYFYCAKASKRDRDEGNNHPTVKPTDLMRYVVRMVTPPSGTVLDPFTGSGSTGKACIIEGFNFVGVELSSEYAEIARARIEYAKHQKPDDMPQEVLFDD